MTEKIIQNSAEKEAEKALLHVRNCIDKRKSFVLEAGAGAGKTYSLVSALRYLIEQEGTNLLRRHQQVACITYTNVARDEIESRTDRHPAIYPATIHTFCWSIIKDFQSDLREELPKLGKWTERLDETGGIGSRKVIYDLGYPSAEDPDHVSLHHNDVLALTVALLEKSKFRQIFADRFPFLFIDEYQDTELGFAKALETHFFNNKRSPLIGFFGDHWQKIYGTGCGGIMYSALEVIGKNSNFRSVSTIVNVLNHMRPELRQEVKDPVASGTAIVYHTNQWCGTRQTEAHWKEDLPSNIASQYLRTLVQQLTSEGWDFSPDKTKILMLTHNILAEEQGYRNLANVYERKESFIQKEDKYIEFFVDIVEPVCNAYFDKRFGDMFAILGGRQPAINSNADKRNWVSDMDKLLLLRETTNIGAVVDHLKVTKRLGLPNAIEKKERELATISQESEDGRSSSLDRLLKLKEVSYKEVIALASFLNGHTPFSTKHGVKGAEFENVLVVAGRGWNIYNFNQMLEWFGSGVPSGKQEAFERNRNLFYVACSRPKQRLAILFTQMLSESALSTLNKWFGEASIFTLSGSI